MPQAVSPLLFLLVLVGYGLSIWPSFHVALSNGSVFVDFNAKSKNNTISNTSLSLVNMETSTSVLSRTLPSNKLVGREEFNCSCFLYAGTFRFLLRQTSITAVSHANRTDVGLSTNEHFQTCSSVTDPALFLEVSYMEHNQVGRNTIDKVRAQTRKPIKPLRSQSVELPCAFPFTERDFIRVALQSPHTVLEVKTSGPLYLSRIFSYKLLVDNVNAYKSGCMGTMTVKMITPPCTHVNGKILLYNAGLGSGVDSTSPVMGFGPEEPSSPPMAFNWLTEEENETEFNCSVFYPGRHKYCFRFVFNFSRSPSPAHTCLVVYRSTESWGPWQPWSVCSVSCGEGVRERVRECLLPSSVQGMQCTGMMKEQSLCSLEDCNNPIFSNYYARVQSCESLIYYLPHCTSVPTSIPTLNNELKSYLRGSHFPERETLTGSSASLTTATGDPTFTGSRKAVSHRSEGVATSIWVRSNIFLASFSISMSHVFISTRHHILYSYRLAQQQLKEMKKQGLKEATQLYHVSSSPVHDTVVESCASPTTSPIPSPTGFACSTLPLCLQDNGNQSHFCTSTPLSELSQQTLGVTSDRLSPRVELVLGPPSVSGRSSKWRDRTADWVEMVERSKMPGLTGGGDAASGNSYHKNPNFRRTSSFNDTKLLSTSSAQSTQFRERSMTQVGSRTRPEGSSSTKGKWERQPHPSYPIPEHRVSDWSTTRAQSNDQRKAWVETAASSRNNQVKHTGTNTNNFSISEKNAKDFSGTGERKRLADPGGRVAELVSGIGGPSLTRPWSQEVNQLGVGRAEWAEQNWNRRGPSPIQRNILARKLKEAQSCSGAKGRQRSSSFNVSSSNQRKDWCHSLPMSRDQNLSGGSPYRLSEAEKRMLDLDLSTVFVHEKE
ncbi:hypothetical protein XENOCAPTIV_014959 [Xenoophorus captivus]|uniref:Thrombospondin, type I, domain containing 1 n=1 Tax=Xenoophorus captivus TaxID=1517983 RepID=A0ABV0QDC9_9TELE